MRPLVLLFSLVALLPARGAEMMVQWGNVTGAPESASTVYVDSVAGSDANDGSSSAAPVQTIAAAMALVSSGDTLRLRCGSTWREMIDASSLTDFTVESYGAGPKPMLDAADPVTTSWTLTEGMSNVYETTVTHATGTHAKHRVWEDGVRLVRVASVEACEAAPGSFYAATPSGTTDTLYVHPSDSASPAENEKLYEFAARKHGVIVSRRSTVRNVHTTRNADGNGSLCSEPSNGVDVLFEDCLATDGTAHNVLIGAGICRRVEAWDCEVVAGVGTSTLFVAYLENAAGARVRFEDCRASMRTHGNQAVIGFFGHGSSTDWDRVDLVRCHAANVATAFSVEATQELNVVDSLADNVKAFCRGANTTATVRLIRCVQRNITHEQTSGAIFAEGGGAQWVLRHCDVAIKAVDQPFLTAANGQTWDVSRCTFVNTANNYPAISVASGAALSLTRCILSTTVGGRIWYHPSGTYTGDYNLFAATFRATNSSNWSDTIGLAAWQSASGQDEHSTEADPVILALPAQASFGAVRFGPASPATADDLGKGAFTDQDPETDALLASLGI